MRLINKRLFCLILVASIAGTSTTSFLFAAQQPVQPHVLQAAENAVEALAGRFNQVHTVTNNCVFRTNEAMGLAHGANATSIRAHEAGVRALAEANQATALINETRATIEQLRQVPAQVGQQTQEAMANLGNEYNRLREALAAQNEHDMNHAIQVERARINERNRLGLFEQAGRFRVQAAVDAETAKWNKIQETIDDPNRIIKIAAAIIVIILIMYAAKYGIPMVIDYFTKPRVISETSERGWFGWGESHEEVRLEDLTFNPALQKKLFDLVSRVKTAKMYKESLPNVLLFGGSGVGKTSFAKGLAYYSDLNYALTSGSEFAKITDLNSVNDELRKLLYWAKNDDNGLIVFIDEAESLFANRKLLSTPKVTQDFINTFLTLVPEGLQKNVMFIFATNHPFKLDDAIIDRIGPKIEFTLPEALERGKILTTYLEKFAQENEEAVIDIHPEIFERLAVYADNLRGLSPRAIKLVAEEMIVNARRKENKQLTHDIAQGALSEVRCNLEQTAQWEKERNEWVSVQG